MPEKIRGVLGSMRRESVRLETWDPRFLNSGRQPTHPQIRTPRSRRRTRPLRLIQPEAMKLPWYEHFFEDYTVPPEIIAPGPTPPKVTRRPNQRTRRADRAGRERPWRARP